jgi:hypothetical protein
MAKVTLCVSVASGGDFFFNLLVHSARWLASGQHDIGLEFTCHTEQQRQNLLRSGAILNVTGSHVVERESSKYFHASSVTHSRCINKLYESVDADIAIICDFDLAFVCKNWDLILVEEILAHDKAFVGTPYAAGKTMPFDLKDGQVVYPSKYQNKPNCTFLAFSPPRTKKIAARLCDFDTVYAGREALPLQFVTNPTEAEQYELPVGSIRQVDVGTPIPRLIHEHKLTFHSFQRRAGTYDVLKSVKVPPKYPSFLLPEEYFYRETPFLVHFRKGSGKTSSESDDAIYSRELFSHDVLKWLNTNRTFAPSS